MVSPHLSRRNQNVDTSTINDTCTSYKGTRHVPSQQRTSHALLCRAHSCAMVSGYGTEYKNEQVTQSATVQTFFAYRVYARE